MDPPWAVACDSDPAGWGSPGDGAAPATAGQAAEQGLGQAARLQPLLSLPRDERVFIGTDGQDLGRA